MSGKQIVVWKAGTKELAAHFAIRHRVFVNEQGALVMTDIDHWDRHDNVVHALAASGNLYAGAVRLYPLNDRGRWKGDRLAVLRQHRNSLVGAQLVRFATATAAARGGLVMEASVQIANVKFFERLGWQRDGGRFAYLGLPHQPMIFDLAMAQQPSKRRRPASMLLEETIENQGDALCAV